jgi:predicted permease
MDTLRQDLRLAWRQLSARPAFTTAAILTLAIGMGVNAVAFSIVNALLLKRSAAHDVPGVGRILLPGGVDDEGNASLIELERIAAATRGALTVAGEARLSVAWHHDNVTEPAWVLFVSDQYFSMVDAPVIAGRLAVEPAAGGAPAVVIGERFWRERLRSRPIAGLTLRLNNVEVSVSGVLPTTFRGPSGLYAPEVWLPLADRSLFGLQAAFEPRDARLLFLMARLAPGVSAPEVQARLDAAAADMAREWPETHRGRTALFRSFGDGNAELRAIRPVAAVVMGIIGLVLLLACFNVASMLLARGVDREREIGIRTALGARPARLTRMMMTEGLLLATAAGGLTVAVASWAQTLVGAFAMPVPSPQHLDLSPDRTIVVFIAALVLIAGVVPGLWPAIASTRVNVSRTLAAQGGSLVSGRPSMLGRRLVTAQIAGSTAFLSVAALAVQLYASAAAFDLGFERERLVVAGVEPFLQGYDRARADVYVARLLERTRSLPGVVDAAVADRVPFYIGYTRTTAVAPANGDCRVESCPEVATFGIGDGLFRTMSRPLRAGREFGPATGQTREVIVNETFARQWWPSGDGLGATLRLGPESTPHIVIGIVGDIRQRLGMGRAAQPDQNDRPTLFVPLAASDERTGFTIVARTAGPAASIVQPMLDAAGHVDRNLPVLYIQTMAQRMEVPLWPFKTLRGLFAVCGLLALVLATVGLAGVVSHAVSRRIREFGVRVAIGAAPRDLVIDVIRSGAAMLVPGLMIGLTLAVAAARLGTLLFADLDPWNVPVYVGVAAVQSSVVVVACLAPALRAARVDPMIALRA